MKKLLGVLGVVAVGGLSAFTAPGAWAVTHTFHGEVEPIVLTAEQESENRFLFTIGEGWWTKCGKVKLQGTAVEKSEEIAGSTELSECTTPIGTAVVNMNGCRNILTGETSESGDARVKLECEEGKAITVESAGCVFKVGSQTIAGGGVHYTDLGEGTHREVTVTVTESEIAYTTNGAFACSLAGIPKSGNNATLSGSLLTKGYKDLAEPGPPQKPPYEEGEQVGIWVE